MKSFLKIKALGKQIMGFITKSTLRTLKTRLRVVQGNLDFFNDSKAELIKKINVEECFPKDVTVDIAPDTTSELLAKSEEDRKDVQHQFNQYKASLHEVVRNCYPGQHWDGTFVHLRESITQLQKDRNSARYSCSDLRTKISSLSKKNVESYKALRDLLSNDFNTVVMSGESSMKEAHRLLTLYSNGEKPSYRGLQEYLKDHGISALGPNVPKQAELLIKRKDVLIKELQAKCEYLLERHEVLTRKYDKRKKLNPTFGQLYAKSRCWDCNPLSSTNMERTRLEDKVASLKIDIAFLRRTGFEYGHFEKTYGPCCKDTGWNPKTKCGNCGCPPRYQFP